MLEVERVVALSLEDLAARQVLDVGTGTGVFAEGFARVVPDVTGIDVNADLLAVARRLVPGARFREAPAEAIPFENEAFDLAFLGLVLHETDDALKALAEARRVARSRVVVLEWPYRQQEAGPPLEHRLTPEAIAGLAADAGFRGVESVALTHTVLYRVIL